LTLYSGNYEGERCAAQFFASNAAHLHCILSTGYSLSSFYAVKSLDGSIHTLEQIEQVQTLTSLKKLVISCSTNAAKDDSLFIERELALLLFTKNAFPMLEYCEIAEWPFLIKIPDVYNVSLPMLRSLTLSSSHGTDFDRILIACPNLVFLDINYHWLDYTFHFSTVTMRHEMLRRLKIQYRYKLMLEHIDHQLKQVPNLESLSLYVHRGNDHPIEKPFEDFQTLACILKTNVPVLRRFHLSVSIYLNNNNDNTMVLKPFQKYKLQLLHPLFADLICRTLNNRVYVDSKI
jgi:hypothetical protein